MGVSISLLLKVSPYAIVHQLILGYWGASYPSSSTQAGARVLEEGDEQPFVAIQHPLAAPSPWRDFW